MDHRAGIECERRIHHGLNAVQTPLTRRMTTSMFQSHRTIFLLVLVALPRGSGAGAARSARVCP